MVTNCPFGTILALQTTIYGPNGKYQHASGSRREPTPQLYENVPPIIAQHVPYGAQSSAVQNRLSRDQYERVSRTNQPRCGQSR